MWVLEYRPKSKSNYWTRQTLTSPQCQSKTSCRREAATICPRPCDLWPLTLKVVSESHVTWATFVPIVIFLGLCVLDLGRMCATDVIWQTDVRQHHRLMPPIRGRGIINWFMTTTWFIFEGCMIYAYKRSIVHWNQLLYDLCNWWMQRSECRVQLLTVCTYWQTCMIWQRMRRFHSAEATQISANVLRLYLRNLLRCK